MPEASESRQPQMLLGSSAPISPQPAGEARAHGSTWAVTPGARALPGPPSDRQESLDLAEGTTRRPTRAHSQAPTPLQPTRR